MPVNPKHIRQARTFLQQRGIGTGTLPPRVLATTADRMQANFADTLRLIMALTSGGQGRGPAPIGEKIITGQETVSP